MNQKSSLHTTSFDVSSYSVGQTILFSVILFYFIYELFLVRLNKIWRKKKLRFFMFYPSKPLFFFKLLLFSKNKKKLIDNKPTTITKKKIQKQNDIMKCVLYVLFGKDNFTALNEFRPIGLNLFIHRHFDRLKSNSL